MRYHEIGTQRVHDTQRLLGGMGRRYCKTKRRQDCFAARATAGVIICDQDERRKAVLVIGTPPATGLFSAF